MGGDGREGSVVGDRFSWSRVLVPAAHLLEWAADPQCAPAANILVVDDSEQVRRLLDRALSAVGHNVTVAQDGETALQIVQTDRPDLVISDVHMGPLDGFALCRALKNSPSTRFVPVVLITGAQEREQRLQGVDAGADDFVTKPIDLQELTARVRSLVRMKHAVDELESAESVLISLALAVEARDAYTYGHSHRLAAYAVLLGEQLGLSPRQLVTLRRGGYVHDIGKIALPDSILLKPGALTEREFEILKQHTIIGEQLCGFLRSLEPVRPIVRHHHERLDGSGYPDGLHGTAIPLLAQVLSVVDEYDAITSSRPYRPAMPHEFALAELHADVARGKLAGPLVSAFSSLTPTRLRDAATSGGPA